MAFSPRVFKKLVMPTKPVTGSSSMSWSWTAVLPGPAGITAQPRARRGSSSMRPAGVRW